MNRTLDGIGVSAGLGTGPALRIEVGIPELREKPLFADDLDAEIARLDTALAEACKHLEDLRERTSERAGPEEARIFEAQILMIEDEEFLSTVRHLILDNHLSAERAFEFVALELRQSWLESKSPLLRERTEDLTAILTRVLNLLVGRGQAFTVGRDGNPRVVVTRELTAGLAVECDGEHVAGIVAEEGTSTSHGAILARGLGIPCVMGVAGALDAIEEGELVIVDGATGRVITHPNPEELEGALARDQRRRSYDEELREAVGQPSVTRDDVQIDLRANLDLPEELDVAVEFGAAGIGLMRTEFLVLGRLEMPTEEGQYAYFSSVAERFSGHPVIVRSYDLGGDKYPAAFRAPPDPNPFLGWRAIRVCLDEPELFETQMRAVLRARQHGDVQLMLPLITGMEEVDASRELLEKAAQALRAAGSDVDADLPLGVMIETPSAVMLTDHLVAKADFLSVGTNDLTQYTLAVDRSNARLAPRFAPLHPAVVRMLAHVAEVGLESGIPLSVCGELASDPMGAVLLIGLGYRTLSVAPNVLPLTKWLIRQMDTAEAHAAAQEVLKARDTRSISHILSDVLVANVDTEVLQGRRLLRKSAQTTFRA
ncbi:MAG: phosphoenolpyruvate--protein phosphotransferase [Gemmatimonadales bacterium]